MEVDFRHRARERRIHMQELANASHVACNALENIGAALTGKSAAGIKSQDVHRQLAVSLEHERQLFVAVDPKWKPQRGETHTAAMAALRSSKSPERAAEEEQSLQLILHPESGDAAFSPPRLTARVAAVRTELQPKKEKPLEPRNHIPPPALQSPSRYTAIPVVSPENARKTAVEAANKAKVAKMLVPPGQKCPPPPVWQWEKAEASPPKKPRNFVPAVASVVPAHRRDPPKAAKHDSPPFMRHTSNVPESGAGSRAGSAAQSMNASQKS